MRISTKFWILLVAILASNCNNDTGNVPGLEDLPGKFENGVFIVNEGPFQTGTGTVGFFDRETEVIDREIFQSANGRPLGNIVQSLQVHDTLVFIVVNNSNKIEVVNLDDFSSVEVIENLPLPRHFVGFNSGKGYVSSWGADGVSGQVDVIDLHSMTVLKTIATGNGSEKMAIVGTSLFVCNGGGFGTDNTISVINTESDELEDQIVVGDNPKSIQMDASGSLWVACAGNQVFNPDFSIDVAQSTLGSLIRINPGTNQITAIIEFPDVFSSPSRLVAGADGGVLYYLRSGSIYSHDLNSGSLSEQPLVEGFFYGLGYDQVNGLIYAADAIDFASQGRVIRYTDAGTATDTLTAGIVPTDFYFN